MGDDMNRRNGNAPKYSGYEDELYKVVGLSDKTEKNGAILYVCDCKRCGEKHLRNAKHLKQKIQARDCKEQRPHNWSGLDRWDAIIRRTYGITLAEYNQMLDKQNGVCAICGDGDEVEGRRLAIDHDHATGEVRGLLCGKCNRGIGLLKDDTGLLEKAITYLQSS